MFSFTLEYVQLCRTCILMIILIEISYNVDFAASQAENHKLVCAEDDDHVAERGNRFITSMDLSNCRSLKLNRSRWDTYAETLENLTIDGIIMVVQRNTVPLNIFAGFNKLRTFRFSNSQLSDSEMWELPRGVTHYDVHFNVYTYINLSMCPDLRVINVEQNLLTKMPVLSQPHPPLEELVLNGNPMDDLTVENIMPLCKLLRFHLTIPADQYLSGADGFCQCFRLKKLVYQLNLDGGVRGCLRLPKSESIKCDLNCAYLKYLRRPCGDANTIVGCVTSSWLDFFKWKSWLIVGLLSCTGVSLCGYFVYMYVKRRSNDEEYSGEDENHDDDHSEDHNEDHPEDHNEDENHNDGHDEDHRPNDNDEDPDQDEHNDDNADDDEGDNDESSS